MYMNMRQSIATFQTQNAVGTTWLSVYSMPFGELS